MRVLHGEITRGYGLATRNLEHVVPLIAARTGVAKITPGTLNVRLPESFLVRPEATVSAAEYDGHEYLKLQRCVVHGIRAVIVRPHKHETVAGWAHGPKHVELVSAVHLRRALSLYDGAPVRIEIEGGWAWWVRADTGDARLLGMRVRSYARRVLRVSDVGVSSPAPTCRPGSAPSRRHVAGVAAPSAALPASVRPRRAGTIDSARPT